jgi:hypothetical protein
MASGTMQPAPDSIRGAGMCLVRRPPDANATHVVQHQQVPRIAVMEIDAPMEPVEDSLLDRMLATDSTLIVLRCNDADALSDALRSLAQRTGKALYFWRASIGLCRLPGRDETVPGVVQLADVLRFIERSPHFGMYFIADLPAEWSADLLALLRRIAQIDAQQPRRLVLLGALADLPAGLPARELTWGPPVAARLRLRHGAWVY